MEEYKLEINHRFKFNQPIPPENKGLFFYKSKLNLLAKLIKSKK